MHTINGNTNNVISGMSKSNNFNTINVNQNYSSTSNKKMLIQQ
jgi:hypothetical protein